jgi:hypothetical protein
MGTGTDALKPEYPLHLGTTLRRGLRAWWDHLGLGCALSAGWMLSIALPLVPAWQSAVRLGVVGVLLASGVSFAVAAWATSGMFWGVWQALAAEEIGLADFIRPGRTRLKQSAALLLVQLAVSGGLVLNVVFYLGLKSGLGLVLSVVFGYGLILWLLACQYQWPLLMAGLAGLIRRDDGGTPGLMSVLRNSLVLVIAAPLYSLSLWIVQMVIAVPLSVSGVGLVLVTPALWAFVSSQALRDHMVRYGMLAPPEEGSAPPDEWSLPK